MFGEMRLMVRLVTAPWSDPRGIDEAGLSHVKSTTIAPLTVTYLNGNGFWYVLDLKIK